MQFKLSHFCVNTCLALGLPVLLGTVGNLSDKWGRRLSAVAASLLRVFFFPGMKLIRANLRLAFPEKDNAQIEKLLADNVFHTVRNWIDFIRVLKHPERLQSFLEDDCFSGFPEDFTQAVFCLPHLGSWELLAQAISGRLSDTAAVAEIFPYPRLNQVLEKSRSYTGMKIIPRKGAVMGVMSALRHGTSVGLLVDQKLSPRHGGVFVDFFGLPATVSPLPGVAAKRYGIQLVSGAFIRQESGKFRMEMKFLDVPESCDKEEAAQIIATADEELIRCHPEQYNWLYKRWSHIPADASEDMKSRFPYYAKITKYTRQKEQ